jgi:hypothetical protein
VSETQFREESLTRAALHRKYRPQVGGVEKWAANRERLRKRRAMREVSENAVFSGAISWLDSEATKSRPTSPRGGLSRQVMAVVKAQR